MTWGLALVICPLQGRQADWRLGQWWLGQRWHRHFQAVILLPAGPSRREAARELGWSLANEVEVYSCDATAQAFQAVLPLTIIGSSLKEGITFAKANQSRLDPTKLLLYYAYAQRICASFRQSYTDGLGVTIGPAAPQAEVAPTGSGYTKYNVFPNCNSNATNTYSNKQVGTTRTTFVPLHPGDFVQLPTIQQASCSLVLWSNV